MVSGSLRKITGVPDIDRIPLASLEDRGYILSPDGAGDNLFGVLDAKGISSQLRPFQTDIEVIAHSGLLGENAAGPGYRQKHVFDLVADLADLIHIGSVDF